VRAVQQRRRWFSPATIVLALLCFALPFATVSCGLPDGYGRARPGGTSEYTGIDLVFGGGPDVARDQLRPLAERRADRIDAQPFCLAALLVVVVALGVTLGVADDRRRRVFAASLGAVAVLCLAAGQLVFLGRLAGAVGEQSTIPAAKTARDFVGTGAGFWLATGLLGALVLGNLAALTSRGRRSPGGRPG
jgi:hypothetical protein